MAHVCPVWIGHFLANPLRRRFQNPERILAPYISEGMTVLDVGCAMGFFSLPIAGAVGETGRVVCVDVQERMLELLKQRAEKEGIGNRIVRRKCNEKSLGIDDLEDQIDFALAFAMVHEVPEKKGFFEAIYRALKPGAVLMVSEPLFHVSGKAFAETVTLAEKAGFTAQEPESKIAGGRTILLRK